MLEQIYNLFRDRARKHLLIRSFHYTRTYNLGSGKDLYPAFILEQDLYGKNNGQNGNYFTNSINFSILIIPKKSDRVIDLQSLAFSAGLNIIESIKQDKDCEFYIQPDWSYITLVDYYDDNAVGCRFSLNVIRKNIENLCFLDNHFNPDKEFDLPEAINDFDIQPDGGCEIFTNKPLKFNLKTKTIPDKVPV